MSSYPHIAARLFNRPLAVESGRLHAVIGAIGARVGLVLDNGEDAAAHAAAAAGGAQERPLRATQGARKIGIVPVLNGLVQRHGRLNAESGVMESYERIGARLEKLVADPEVAGIVLDLDSPGGEIEGLAALASNIRGWTKVKPIYAAVNEHAYSAAYWLAASAERIFIPTTGGVGSIGVIAVHVDQSQFDETMGLRYSTVTAGERKADFSTHAPLSAEAHKRLQAEVDRVHELFVEHIAASRPHATLSKVRDASLYFGPDAVRVGLADEIGGMEEAIAAMSQDISSRDTPAAAASPAPAPAASGERSASVVELSAARAEGEAASAQRVAEISRLCRLAKLPEMAAEFLEKGMTVQQVSEALIEAHAAASDAAHAAVDHRTTFGLAAEVGDRQACSQMWRDAFAAAFGPRALEVTGKHYYDQPGGRSR
jgi:capsid assembly protease